MTTRDAIREISRRLEGVYPAGEVKEMTRVIFEHLLGWTRVKMVMHDDDELLDFIPARIDAILSRLEQGEPLQYVLGEARFHGHSFEVTPATLIPRPETEQLVDLVVDRCSLASDLNVLDIGTGTGCIALSLARALHFPRVTAIDISAAALEVAARNASALNAKIKLLQADILSATSIAGEPWNVIVSNPPYVLPSEAQAMERHVLAHEPHSALFVPEDDPLCFHRAIARYATRQLADGGLLAMEINPLMAADTRRLLVDIGFADATLYTDFNARQRFIIATRQR